MDTQFQLRVRENIKDYLSFRINSYRENGWKITIKVNYHYQMKPTANS